MPAALTFRKGGGIMPVKAYVLIEVTPGTSREVAAKAKAIEGVKSVSVVTGPHDVIALVEINDAKALGDLLITKLQKIEGVAGTMTDVVID
jgi:DNA-binding Lrp family transcriptional regulator